ncbi:MAG: DUF917 domain-containing protein [Polyangiaceae bacterium]|nr:DUF917 domain-containing protein [Polyangiaceae bacterium]
MKKNKSNPAASLPTSPFDEVALRDVLVGATLLGAGGGGPFALGEQLLGELLAKTPVIDVVSVRDVPDDAWMAVSAGVGSPTAAASGFPFDAATIAFRALEAVRGAPFDLVLPGEVGAGNSILPMTVCASRGLPLVDASGADRAMPTLDVSTYAAHGLPLSPVLVANGDLSIRFDAPDATTADATLRGIISGGAFREDAGVAFWSMTGATMKPVAVAGTLSRARAVGRALREARARERDPVAAVAKLLRARELFRGEIVDVAEDTAGGFDLGVVTLRQGKRTLRIYNQNENLFAWDGARTSPVALSPDLICFITSDGAPFSNAEAADVQKAGSQVVVLGVASNKAGRARSIVDAYLALMRPLGYGGPYVPLERLAP